MKTYLLTGLLAVFLFSGCRKYEEGPTVSLWPRKERIEGKWVAAKVAYNTTDSTSAYKDYIWEFTRNYSVIVQVNKVKRLGVWGTMTSDKDFVIDYDDGERQLFEIRKMTRKEFWIRNKQSQLEFQLKPY
ncbi:MAG: hypothetical protein JNL57_07045 [Bacteroidetes bacterium]|nr:hypothetical protein [Bacteroidota bacterium]